MIIITLFMSLGDYQQPHRKLHYYDTVCVYFVDYSNDASTVAARLTIPQ